MPLFDTDRWSSLPHRTRMSQFTPKALPGEFLRHTSHSESKLLCSDGVLKQTNTKSRNVQPSGLRIPWLLTIQNIPLMSAVPEDRDVLKAIAKARRLFYCRKQCGIPAKPHNYSWLSLVFEVTKTNEVQKSIQESCFSDSLPLPFLLLPPSRLQEAAANSTSLNNNSH